MKQFLKDEFGTKRKTWKKALVIMIVSVLGIYFVFMAAYFVTSEPKFCVSCHWIDPYYSSWNESAHKDVKCLYCHEFRGFLGKLHSKARGLNFVYQHWTGQYTIYTKGQVFEQNCIACHLGDYWNYPDTIRLNMKHYDLIKQDKSCLECHREVGHRVNLFSKEKFTR